MTQAWVHLPGPLKDANECEIQLLLVVEWQSTLEKLCTSFLRRLAMLDLQIEPCNPHAELFVFQPAMPRLCDFFAGLLKRRFDGVAHKMKGCHIRVSNGSESPV